jgi:VanZ family protein
VTGRRALALWLPPLAYLAVIFALSSMSHPPVPRFISQDLLHYPEYALLGFLLARALHGDGDRHPALSSMGLALLLTAFFGAADEVHQAFVPNRLPDLVDLRRDVIGGAAGILFWWGWRWRRS